MQSHTLLITDSYPPEIRSASHLMYELAQALHTRHHTVSVITTFPQYNLAESQQGRNLPEISDEEGIRVIRIHTFPIHNVGFLRRGIGVLSLPGAFIRGIKKHIKTPIDRVLVYSPPLPLAKAGAWVAQKYHARYLLNVQDIFPQNAIDLGIMKNHLLIHFFKRMEHKAYQRADHVTVHSTGNREFLLKEQIVEPEKLSILHNWVDPEPFDKTTRTNTFRKRFGLENRFIVLFAGVLGPAQGLDTVIHLAEKTKDIEEIVYLLVGDGTEKDRLQHAAQSRKLHSIQFRPFVSKEEYPSLVKEVDVVLVCLSSQMKTPVVPGKLQGYMAAQIPVLATLNAESDGFAIIHDSQCGFVALSEDTEQAATHLRTLYKMSPEARMALGQNGRRYVEKYFAKDVCVSEIEHIFSSIDKPRGKT